MGWDQLAAKLRTLSRGVLPEARAEAIIAAVHRLPQGGLGPLMELLKESA
jgi:hypothetical protein